MKSPLNIPIILASTSPRRIELLSQVRMQVKIKVPTASEDAKRGEKPKALVSRLAALKAESVLEEVLAEFGGGVIIAADTIVVEPSGKRVLNKPRDQEEAFRMLKLLQGRTHTVHTGYCILAAKPRASGAETERIIRVVSSKVTMRPLSSALIERYIASGEPMDKAGAYAAQGQGMALIERIQGSYTNVVGLPIAQLLMDLEKSFGIVPFSGD